MAAFRTLRLAYSTDVSPILALARIEAGGAVDPIFAYRESGWRLRKAQERKAPPIPGRASYNSAGFNLDKDWGDGVSPVLMRVNMHATERDRVILSLLEEQGFVSFRELSHRVTASPATLRRDLERLQTDGKLVRVRGGVQPMGGVDHTSAHHLQGVPFHENINRNRAAKEAIGKAAAELCKRGEAIIIDGGSTTLHMCPHLEQLKLQVLTNSLHIVSALLQQQNTGITITGGVVFREQNIVLDPFEDVEARIFHASRMFMGTAAVTRHGLMQSDVILIQAERKLLAQAEEVVVLVDSSKFTASAGHLLCDLSRVHMLITDDKIDDTSAKMVEAHGVKLIVVDV